MRINLSNGKQRTDAWLVVSGSLADPGPQLCQTSDRTFHRVWWKVMRAPLVLIGGWTKAPLRTLQGKLRMPGLRPLFPWRCASSPCQGVRP
jgi:hypothetical protein